MHQFFRIKVAKDLLAVFMEGGIMNLTLNMDFINEKAVDDVKRSLHCILGAISLIV